MEYKEKIKTVAIHDNITMILTTEGDIYFSKDCSSEWHLLLPPEGKIPVDIQLGNNRFWLLTSRGEVYLSPLIENNEYYYEIFSPASHCGEIVIKISSGRDHLLMLTDRRKVYGTGDNSCYQLVPHGEKEYCRAVEIQVTSYLSYVDNFEGNIIICDREIKKKPYFLQKEVCNHFLGYFAVPFLNDKQYAVYKNSNGDQFSGSLLVPLFFSYRYEISGYSTNCTYRDLNLKFTVSSIFFGKNPGNPDVCDNNIYLVTSNEQVIRIQADIPNPPVNILSSPLVLKTALTSSAIASRLSYIVFLHFNAGLLTHKSTANLIFGGTQTPQTLINLQFVTTPTGSPVPFNYTLDGGTTKVLIPIINGSVTIQSNINPISPYYVSRLRFVAVNTPEHLEEISFPITIQAQLPFISIAQPIQKLLWENIYTGSYLSLLTNSACQLFVLGSLYHCRKICEDNLPKKHIYLNLEKGKKIGSITLYHPCSIQEAICSGSNRLIIPVEEKDCILVCPNYFLIRNVQYCAKQILVLQISKSRANVDLYLSHSENLTIYLSSQNTCSTKIHFPILQDNHLKLSLVWGPFLRKCEYTSYQSILGCSNGEKLILAYVQDGLNVSFVIEKPESKIIYQFPITPDLPTLFHLSHKILDIAAGLDYFTLLLERDCRSSEIYTFGNPVGEGICQTPSFFRISGIAGYVVKIFSFLHITLYLTDGGKIYYTGCCKYLPLQRIPKLLTTIQDREKLYISSDQILLLKDCELCSLQIPEGTSFLEG